MRGGFVLNDASGRGAKRPGFHEREGAPLIAAEAHAIDSLRERASLAPTLPATRREREVLGLLATGLSDKEAAKQLRISERTVQVHIRNFCRRNGVRNRVEGVALWATAHCEPATERKPDPVGALRRRI